MMVAHDTLYYGIVLYTVSIATANGAVGALIPACLLLIRRGVLLDHMYLGEGLPHMLRTMLSLLEVLSWSFRWASLSLRIACNSIAGHVLLSVLLDMLLPVVRHSIS